MRCESCHKRIQESGAKGSRTLDLCIANAALSQLSYRPMVRLKIRNVAGDIRNIQVYSRIGHPFVRDKSRWPLFWHGAGEDVKYVKHRCQRGRRIWNKIGRSTGLSEF